MSYIYVIYKRFLGSGISDLLVSTCVIVEGSDDQAWRGKHYSRGFQCIMLWWKALIHKRLTIVLQNEFLSTENIHNLEVLKKVLTENKANLASAFADLEIDENV